MRRLPLAYECDRRWEDLAGDSGVRQCCDCDRQVVDLSSLDEASAKLLLAERTAPACVRFRQRRGRIVFAKVARAVAFAAAAAVLLAPPTAQADTSPPEPPRRREAKPPKKHKREPAPKKRTDDELMGILTPTF